MFVCKIAAIFVQCSKAARIEMCIFFIIHCLIIDSSVKYEYLTYLLVYSFYLEDLPEHLLPSRLFFLDTANFTYLHTVYVRKIILL